MHVKKGDKVMVITGRDKGRTGTVLAAFPKKDRVLVEGGNVVKTHSKPSQGKSQGGGISKEAAIHVSNVMRLAPKSNEAPRMGYTEEIGKKERVAKKSGEALDK